MMFVVREEFGVEALFVHQSFKSKTFDNDIGLLKLSGQVRLDRHTPVCLPTSRMTQGGVSVWITGEVVLGESIVIMCLLGWGVLEENSWQTPSKLNELELRYSASNERGKCKMTVSYSGQLRIVSVRRCSGPRVMTTLSPHGCCVPEGRKVRACQSYASS